MRRRRHLSRDRYSSDGDRRDYLDLADAITETSPSTRRDLNELWCRILLSIAVHNTDDHLRNHGFLRTPGGWRLAPMFDVNPEPDLAASRAHTALTTWRDVARRNGVSNREATMFAEVFDRGIELISTVLD